MSAKVILKEAAQAWKHLNGIICVYKPVGIPLFQVNENLKNKLCDDLNSMKCREPEKIVKMERIEAGNEPLQIQSPVAASAVPVKRPKNNSTNQFDVVDFTPQVLHTIDESPNTKLQVVKVLNYADHPLVVGPRYQRQDFKWFNTNHLGVNTSGVAVIGLNKAAHIGHKLKFHRWLSSYIISAEFGKATEDGFYTSAVVEKNTYHKIRSRMVEKVLASLQSNYQRVVFQAAGVPLDSEEAYHLASKGLVRPKEKTEPIIYGLKLLKFDLPHFEFEVHTINEREDFLKTIPNSIALKLHSCAMSRRIRCIKHGPFNVDLALLQKHWSLEHILTNMAETEKMLSEIDINVRDPWLTSMKPAAETEIAEASGPVVYPDDLDFEKSSVNGNS